MPAEKPRGRFLGYVAAGVILLGSYLIHPPPKPDIKEKATRGEYISKFVEEKNNSLHDYIIAARLHKNYTEFCEPKLNSSGWSASPGYDEEFSKFCRGDANEAPPNIMEYLKYNKPAIEMVKTGLLKNNYVSPEFTGFSESLTYLSSDRKLAQLLVADGKIKESKGDYQGAIENYFSITKLAEEVSSGGRLIEGLVGAGLDSLAFTALRDVLPKLNENELEKILLRIKGIEPPSFSRSLGKEKYFSRDITEHMLKTGDINTCMSCSPAAIKNPSYFSWVNLEKVVQQNALYLYFLPQRWRIRGTMEKGVREMIETADLPLTPSDFDEESNYAKDSFIPQIIPRILPPAANCKKNFANIKTMHTMLETSTAIHLFNRRNNRLPENLQELVDNKILSEMPIDRFSNSPLNYDKERGLLWSIGKDGKNDNGEKEYGKGEDRSRGDIIFRLENF